MPTSRDVALPTAKSKPDPSARSPAADRGNDLTQKTAVTIAADDGSDLDLEAAKAEMATVPNSAVSPADAALASPATRQPGFPGLLRALGMANGKAPTEAAPDGSAGETAATPAAPEATIPIVAAGTSTPPQATRAEAQTGGRAKVDATDGDRPDEAQTETATAVFSGSVPVMLPPPPQASPGSSPSIDAAETTTGPAPAIADRRPGSARAAADPSGLLAAPDMPSNEGTKTASAIGTTGSAETSVPGSPPGKPSFGEHLAKATAEATQIAAAAPAADPSASTAPSQLAVPASAPGLQAVAAHAAAPAAPAHPVVSGVPISAVPVEIGMKTLQGVNRFDIRLDPDDLGQIDVRLDISETGSVRAHIVVERPEALASLQRETTHLERALEQAGFRAEDGVSLSLRQHTGGEAGNGRGGDGRETRPDPTLPGMTDADAATTNQPTRRVTWTRASGIDRHI